MKMEEIKRIEISVLESKEGSVYNINKDSSFNVKKECVYEPDFNNVTINIIPYDIMVPIKLKLKYGESLISIKTIQSNGKLSCSVLMENNNSRFLISNKKIVKITDKDSYITFVGSEEEGMVSVEYMDEILCYTEKDISFKEMLNNDITIEESFNIYGLDIKINRICS